MGFFDRFKKNKNVQNDDGLNEVYFNDGKSDQIKRRCNKSNGVFDGLYESFYESGELEYRGEFKKGNQEGLWTAYFKNGKINKESLFKKDSKISGKQWDEIGNLVQEVKTKDQATTYEYFYPNGALKELRQKKENEHNFFIESYRKDGSKSFNGYYEIIKKQESRDLIRLNKNSVTVRSTGRFRTSYETSGFTSEFHKRDELKELLRPQGIWNAFNENGDILYQFDLDFLNTVECVGEVINHSLYLKRVFNSEGKETSSEVYKQYYFDPTVLNRDDATFLKSTIDTFQDGTLPVLNYIFDVGEPLLYQFPNKTESLMKFFESDNPPSYGFDYENDAYKLINEFMLSHDGLENYKSKGSQRRWLSKNYDIKLTELDNKKLEEKRKKQKDTIRAIAKYIVQIETINPSVLKDEIREEMEDLLNKLFLKAGQTINICSASGGWPLEKIEESMKKAITYRNDFNTLVEREFYFWKYPQEKLKSRIDDDDFKSLCTKEKVSDDEGFMNFFTDIGGYNPNLDNGGKWWQRMIHILGKDSYAGGLGQLRIYEEDKDPEMLQIAISLFENALAKNIPEAQKELDRLRG